jgi:hypothetical protein
VTPLADDEITQRVSGTHFESAAGRSATIQEQGSAGNFVVNFSGVRADVGVRDLQDFLGHNSINSTTRRCARHRAV